MPPAVAPVFHSFGPPPSVRRRPEIRPRTLAATPSVQTPPADLAAADTVRDSSVLQKRLRALREDVTLAPHDPRVER